MRNRQKGLRFKDHEGVLLDVSDWGADGVVLDTKQADRACLNLDEATKLRDWLSRWIESQQPNVATPSPGPG